jgi:hypothetical protein
LRYEEGITYFSTICSIEGRVVVVSSVAGCIWPRDFGRGSSADSFHQLTHSKIAPQQELLPHQKEPRTTLMRLIFPQYLFPSFLIHRQSSASDTPPKNRSRGEITKSAGITSFTYLCCKGCHTPCPSPWNASNFSDKFRHYFKGFCRTIWPGLFMSKCNQR